MEQQSTGNIPLLDTTPEIESLWDELNGAIQRVLKSGQFIMGPEVTAFEQEVSEYLGVEHAIAVNSGTDALVIALRAMGIGPGDEVITTPFTFFATAESISMVGATPVFVDIHPSTFNIDPSQIEKAITHRTKAILPVHLFGQAADMDAILAVAEIHGLKVLEDVAQAFSGEYKGQKLGTIGDAGAYSFFPTKNLGAFGDGGLITTNSETIAEASRMLRVHGAKKKYYNETIGYNSRLDSIQAALLRVKLPYIDGWSEARKHAAEKYNKLIAGIPGIITPAEIPEVKHVYHQYTLRIRNGKRTEVQTRLLEAGISSMVYYPVPVHMLPIYKYAGYHMPYAGEAAAEVLSIPIWPQITPDIQERVSQQLSKAIGR